MAEGSNVSSETYSDNPVDHHFDQLLRAGLLAFQRSRNDQRNWLTQARAQLTTAEWGKALWLVIGSRPDQYVDCDQTDYRQTAKLVILKLLKLNDIRQAQHLWEALCQDNPTDDFSLTRSELTNMIRQSLAQAQQQPHLSGLRELRERLFELDPEDIDNDLALIKNCIESNDEFSAALFSQALASTIIDHAQDAKIDSAAQLEIKQNLLELLVDIQESGFYESFFELIEAYIVLIPQSLHSVFYAVLALAAKDLAPERLDFYQSRGSINDLQFIRSIRTTLKRFLKLSLFIGEGLRAVADHYLPDQAEWVKLMSQAAYYLGLSGNISKMKRIIEEIIDQWPPDKLQERLLIYERVLDTRANLADHPQSSISSLSSSSQSDQFDDHQNSLTPEPASLIYKLHGLFLEEVMYFLNYCTDDRELIRSYHQILGPAYSCYIRSSWPQLVQDQDTKALQPNRTPNLGLNREQRPLRVGYLSNSFRYHSVGFLSYQALGYHDPAQVQTYLYSFLSDHHDPIRQEFEQLAHRFHDFGDAPVSEIVSQIRADQLDILVFLDVLTAPRGCQVLALRVAPIQMCWLGGDSPGLPEIDYFLVDPHILPPEAAQDYSEHLLHLPSFLAVESFTVAQMDQAAFREHLHIPADAVIFFTAAIGFKRHPDCIRWHLEILKQVPHAILIIKGKSDLPTLIEAYREPALALGVTHQLRFLARTSTPEAHRAQVGLADIILDTFPYSGSTHTAEALWRGVPVLTCVGRHYYSRMSYSQLMTIGEMDPCIAWSAEEFILKGVQLGHDPDLRQRLRQRLQDTRTSSLLWDARYFARCLETAYRRVVEGEPDDGWIAHVEHVPGPDQRSTAVAWNQQGCQRYRAGQAAATVAERRALWELALWDWQKGLTISPRYLPCYLNRIWLLKQLGEHFKAWQEGLDLLGQIRFGLLTQLEREALHLDSEPDLIWKPEGGWRWTGPASEEYYYLTLYWLATQAGVFYRLEALPYWQQVLDLQPQDQHVRWLVTLHLLAHNKLEGLHHLNRILQQNPDHSTAHTIFDLVRYGYWGQFPRGWIEQGNQRPQRPDCHVEYEGYQMVLEPTLSSIGTVILLGQGRWFESEIEFCRSYLKPGMTMIDVGANIGVYTFLAARCVGATGKVYAIEPDQVCVACLDATIERNQLHDHVEVLQAAVGAEARKVKLFRQRASALNKIFSEIDQERKNGIDGNWVEVEQISLDQWWIQKSCPEVHLLKVDVEGMELDVFKGASQLLRQSQPLILFEQISSRQEENAETTRSQTEAIERYLRSMGYTIYRYIEGLRGLEEAKALKQPTSLNLIAAHSERLPSELL